MTDPDHSLHPLTRRRFMTLAGGTAGLVLVGCSGETPDPVNSDLSSLAPTTADTAAVGASPTPAPTASPLPTSTPAADGRVLVVVQMGGGNDGLNTLVPTTGVYRDMRPTLALPESELITISGTDSTLHPSLAPVADLWERGQVAAMQAVGLPEQSRSHFVALDTWWAGEPGATTGGWLGRWMDATAPEEFNPVRAVALGGGSPALIGQQSSPVIVQSLDGFDLRDRSRTGAVTDAFALMGAGDDVGLLGRAQDAIPVTIEALDQLSTVLIPHDDGEDGYGPADTTALFAAAADLIDADLGTEVILINLGGYDTHANQLNVHAGLLDDLAAGLHTLFERLAGSGNAERTLAMTFSEFGRRVGENGSAGTDHGNGGVAFLIGPAVRGSQVVGEVDLTDLDRGDVPMDLDARSLYANALDWLGGPSEEVLGGEWDTYDLIAV